MAGNKLEIAEEKGRARIGILTRCRGDLKAGYCALMRCRPDARVTRVTDEAIEMRRIEAQRIAGGVGCDKAAFSSLATDFAEQILLIMRRAMRSHFSTAIRQNLARANSDPLPTSSPDRGGVLAGLSYAYAFSSWPEYRRREPRMTMKTARQRRGGLTPDKVLLRLAPP